jgi:hypothetical protein
LVCLPLLILSTQNFFVIRKRCCSLWSFGHVCLLVLLLSMCYLESWLLILSISLSVLHRVRGRTFGSVCVCLSVLSVLSVLCCAVLCCAVCMFLILSVCSFACCLCLSLSFFSSVHQHH